MSPEPFRSSIVVAAEPETVFDYFTVPERIVRWMGDYAVLDPQPGGEFTLDINGVPVRGMDDLQRLMDGDAIGHDLKLAIYRDGRTVEITVVPTELTA